MLFSLLPQTQPGYTVSFGNTELLAESSAFITMLICVWVWGADIALVLYKGENSASTEGCNFSRQDQLLLRCSALGRHKAIPTVWVIPSLALPREGSERPSHFTRAIWSHEFSSHLGGPLFCYLCHFLGRIESVELSPWYVSDPQGRCSKGTNQG